MCFRGLPCHSNVLIVRSEKAGMLECSVDLNSSNLLEDTK